MGRRRSYDDEFKKDAVQLVVEDGQSIRAVEESLGITQGVLKDWVKAYRQSSTSEDKTDKDLTIRKLEKELERVKREREILKSSGHLLKGPESIFRFIAGYRTEFSVQEMCRVLGVSRSGFYKWMNCTPSKREQDTQKLKVIMKKNHKDHKCIIGSPKMKVELEEKGFKAGKNRIAKLMREEGLHAKTHKRFRVVTTDSNHNLPVAENLLNRKFDVSHPGQVLISDITYQYPDRLGLFDSFYRPFFANSGGVGSKRQLEDRYGPGSLKSCCKDKRSATRSNDSFRQGMSVCKRSIQGCIEETWFHPKYVPKGELLG